MAGQLPVMQRVFCKVCRPVPHAALATGPASFTLNVCFWRVVMSAQGCFPSGTSRVLSGLLAALR